MKRGLFTLVVMLVASFVFGQAYEKGKFVSKVSGDTLLYRYLTPENP